MILARIFPVGLLSKNEKDNVWICSYKSCRIFNNILLEISPYIYNEMIEKYSDSLKKLEKKYEISIEITKTESINQKGEKIIYK